VATKAERFKAAAERSGAKRTKKPLKHERDKQRVPNPASHNESQRAARNSSYEMEFAATPRPSRKSTRKSSNRQKTDSALRTTAMSQLVAPSRRASRSKTSSI
jgi:hypothetical protein